MSKKDLRLMIGDVKFSVRAAAVLKKDNKILFQQKKVIKYGLFQEVL